MVTLRIFFQTIFRLPKLLFWLGRDAFFYLKDKGWMIFEGWGLHLYVGKFGSGKTSAMVSKAYNMACKYPQLSIVTNLSLHGFPAKTKILPLKSSKDILEAPPNTLVLIDEIGTIFNSRDFAASKESVPKILFQHLCQCRKRRMMILATTQRYLFCDKQLRDIAASVRVCRMHFGHPFSRLGSVRVYDAPEYERAISNPAYLLRPLGGYVYVQTDKIRALYDTAELIENMLKADYVSDKEVLLNRGGTESGISEVPKQVRRNIRRL